MSRTKTDKPCEAAAFAEGQVWKGRGVELTWDAWEALCGIDDEWLGKGLGQDGRGFSVYSESSWFRCGWSGQLSYCS